MENQQVTHTTVNGKYRLVIERAASTKGVLGYKIEVNGDDMADAFAELSVLKGKIECITPIAATEPEPAKRTPNGA